MWIDWMCRSRSFVRLKVRSPRHWRHAKRGVSEGGRERRPDEDGGLGVGAACRWRAVVNGEEVVEEEREEAERDDAGSRWVLERRRGEASREDMADEEGEMDGDEAYGECAWRDPRYRGGFGRLSIWGTSKCWDCEPFMYLGSGKLWLRSGNWTAGAPFDSAKWGGGTVRSWYTEVGSGRGGKEG